MEQIVIVIQVFFSATICNKYSITEHYSINNFCMVFSCPCIIQALFAKLMYAILWKLKWHCFLWMFSISFDLKQHFHLRFCDSKLTAVQIDINFGKVKVFSTDLNNIWKNKIYTNMVLNHCKILKLKVRALIRGSTRGIIREGEDVHQYFML